MQDSETRFTPRMLLRLGALLLAARLLSSCFLSVADPSEARYAAIGRNMAVTGDYLVPQLVHDGIRQPFEGKPPLYFQMSGIACRVFGINEFAVRFPALLSALLILALTYWTVRRLKDETTAVLATLLCMSSAVFVAFSGLCMTDLLLAATVNGAVFSYALFAAEEPGRAKKAYSILFFAFLGTGMIVKGPVALVMAGLPVFLFVLIGNRWKELRHHAWISGTAVFLLICVPWYYLMTRRQPDFLEYFFINENFKRFLFKEYGDRYGQGRESFRGMALIWALLCTLPFALLVAVPRAARNLRLILSPRRLREPLLGSALLTLLAITGFWCLTSRVLVTYLLPVIPAAAVCIACLLQEAGLLQDARFSRALSRGIHAVAAVCILVMLLAPLFADRYTDELSGRFLKKLRACPEARGLSVYFVRKTPYSAEFYLGDAVRNHPPESAQTSFDNSRRDILVFSDWYQEDVDPLLARAPRKLLFRQGKWFAYAPVDIDESGRSDILPAK